MSAVEQTSVEAMIDEWRETGITNMHELAEKIVDDLSRETLINWIAQLLSHGGKNPSFRRRARFFEPHVEIETGTAPEREGVEIARMVLNLSKQPISRQYDQRWNVNGVEKETRELTVDGDLKQMIEAREKVARYTIFQLRYLQEVRVLAKKHKAKVLGDLEEKGIPLPSVELQVAL